MPSETSTTPEKSRVNGQTKGKQPRVITSPGESANGPSLARGPRLGPIGDVAGLVMMQIDAVNSKKDDLTIAIKGLADDRQGWRKCRKRRSSFSATAKQLVRAYAQQQAVIEKLGKRVKELEAKDK